MPFKSQAQRRACWAKYHKDLKAGIKPRWDCKEWEAETASMPMPSGDEEVLLTAKQDLATFSSQDLQTMANHYGLATDKVSSDDLAWLLALQLFTHQD